MSASDFQGAASQSGSHLGGDSVRERTNNSKHYTENARLAEVFKLYSTLEEQPMAEDI